MQTLKRTDWGKIEDANLKTRLLYCSLFCFVFHSKCLVLSLILHHHNKPWFHPVFNTIVSVLCYERICRRKLPRSGSKRTSFHVTASTGWKCTVQGQNATAPLGTNVCVQSTPFRVRMPVLCISSDFQCHNVTIQGRKCTIPIKSNDAFWHERWAFTRGQNHPSSVLARTTVEWKLGSFDYPTLLTLRQRLFSATPSLAKLNACARPMFSSACFMFSAWKKHWTTSVSKPKYIIFVGAIPRKISWSSGTWSWHDAVAEKKDDQVAKLRDALNEREDIIRKLKLKLEMVKNVCIMCVFCSSQWMAINHSCVYFSNKFDH